MDASERALLEQTVRDAIATSPADADDALLDVGWRDMLEAEPRDAIEIVFGALGAANAHATALDDVLLEAAGWLVHSSSAFLLPEFGSWSAPGHIDGDRLTARGLATERITSAEELIVTGFDEDHAMVPLPSAHLTCTPVRGIDPEARLYRVELTLDVQATDPVERHSLLWADAVAAGRRAIAHQISGACRTMLSFACTHALERVQFGKPVAGFQAVRHRLADALVAIESLDAALGAAWDEPNATTAALAKAIAGRTARTVATQCQQVLAGIGFTTDHPFHRYLKRTMTLEGLFGSSDEIVTDLGRTLLTTRVVPTLIEL